jgi:hypothetical protein
MFMLNFFFEFSGFNADSVSSANATPTEKTEMKTYKYPIVIISLLIISVLMYFAYQANIPHSNLMLGLEVFIFCTAYGASSAYVAKNHGASTTSTTITGIGSGVMFGLIHIALQKGGFYDYSLFV